MRKILKFKTTMMLLMAILIMPNVFAVYSGTGTFTKVTSINDLTDGYYVVAFGTTYAMSNTNAGTYFGRAAITPSGNILTDPATSIVWEIKTHNDGGRTIFNEATAKYVSYTGSSNEAYAVNAVTAGAQRWTFTYSSSLFTITNVSITTRFLQYNGSASRFACYLSSSNQSNITLYKLDTPTCTPSELAFAQSSVNKIVTDAAFTQAATSANATTAITYASTVEGVATVNENTGEVTIVGAGSTTITATQAAGTHNAVSYCSSTATYTLNVASTAPTITVTEVTVPAFSAYATETDSEIIQVSGANLTESIGLQLTGDNANLFSLSTNSVTSTANNVAVTVYYNPTTPGSHTATLTLTSAGATSVVRTLNGSSTWKPLTTPVATEASNITNASFTANWDAVVGATEYEVNVTKETVTPVFATDLFISEYVEGGSNNKYIEIYNGTGGPVDLSNYQLGVAANGSSTLSYSALSGTLANGAVLVLKNSQASLTLPNGVSAINNGACSFTGDDAVVLSKVSPAVFVDIFGRIGDDPGSFWASASNSTENKTLVRKPTVTGGVTTSPIGTGGTAFTTLESEWTQYSQDVVSNLGSHTMNATSVSSTPIAESPFTVTGDNSKTITGLDAGVTYKYTVTAKNTNVTSSVSNTISVVTSTGTRIEQTNNNTNIYSVNGKLIVESQVATTVNIYNAVGQLIDTKQAHAGKNTFTVAAKGIVFVKSNNTTAKVIL